MEVLYYIYNFVLSEGAPSIFSGFITITMYFFKYIVNKNLKIINT